MRSTYLPGSPAEPILIPPPIPHLPPGRGHPHVDVYSQFSPLVSFPAPPSCSPSCFTAPFPTWPSYACRVEQSCHITWQAGCNFGPITTPMSEGPVGSPCSAPATPSLTPPIESPLDLTRKEAESPRPAGERQALWRPFDVTMGGSTPVLHGHNLPKSRFAAGLRRAGGKQPVTHCHQCRRYFASLRDLNKHFQGQHMSALVREFQVAKSWKSLAAEEMSFEELEKTVEENTGFQCPHCQFFAKWPTELQKHIMVHSKERPHQCVVCGLTYKWKWDLGRHFEKSHEGMPNPYKKINRIITKLLNQWGDKTGANRAVMRKEFGL